MGSKVSVCIPMYNTAPYLGACLESVLGQTYTNIEIVVVDDGSTDGSEILIEQYAKTDSRIRVFHQQNSGVSAARNAAIAHADGEYIYLLDSDDIIVKNAIELLVRAAEESQADVAIADMTRMETNGILMDAGRKLTGGVYGLAEQNGSPQFWYAYPYTAAVCMAGGKLIKTEFLRKRANGAHYRSGVIYEDSFFFMDLFTSGCKIVIIEERLYIYRVRNGSGYNSPKPDYLERIKLTRKLAFSMLARCTTPVQENWVYSHCFANIAEAAIQVYRINHRYGDVYVCMRDLLSDLTVRRIIMRLSTGKMLSGYMRYYKELAELLPILRLVCAVGAKHIGGIVMVICTIVVNITKVDQFVGKPLQNQHLYLPDAEIFREPAFADEALEKL